jgi:hypothetical protein
MSKLYFAWTGGASYPAFAKQTTANIWGGSLQTSGNVWGGSFSTQGDLVVEENTVANVADTLPLTIGTNYFIQGPGIPQSGYSPSTSFTFDGSDTFNLSASPYGVVGAGIGQASLIITSEAARTKVTNLYRTDGLIVGETYNVSGGGIEPGTTTVYDGSDALTLSELANSTAWQASITLTNPAGRNVVQLADITGLIAGQVYSLFGPGIAANNFFTFDGTFNAVLTTEAGASRTAAFVSIIKGRTEDDGGPFLPTVHNVVDEDIFEFDVEHSEGALPTLTLDIRNPRIGLLAPSRQQWCWLSYEDDDGDLTPLFNGRLAGVPTRLTAEIVRLSFIAKPTDYAAQKAALAQAMRVLPYFDPLWLQSNLNDPDTVLETYSEHWHVDRVSLVLSTSDILVGEDGTQPVGETEFFYDSLELGVGQTPLASVIVTAALSWTQYGEGQVDLTPALVSAFQSAGSPFVGNIVGSMTSDGLLTSWPKPLAGIGGGWSMAGTSTATFAGWMGGFAYQATYIDQKNSAASSPLRNQFATNVSLLYAALSGQAWETLNIEYPIDPLAISFILQWDASRPRAETLFFTLSSDTQAVLTDPGSSQDETIALSSQFVTDPIDPDGAMPIGDARRPSYFATDRGDQSLQYLLLLARARLRARSRAVTVKFETPFGNALGLSCRWNVQLTCARLPGGQAQGKIINYRLMGNGDGEAKAEITIGCAVGYGNTLAAPGAPTDSYADDYADGYTSVVTALSVIGGELQYAPIAGAIDDDGVDLFNMTPDTVLIDLYVAGGVTAQKAAIDADLILNPLVPDPVGDLTRNPTIVTVDLVPVTGGSFLTEFLVMPDLLMIPQQIDLESAT